MKNLLLSALLVPLSVTCMAAVREIPVGRTVEIKGVERIEASSSVKVHYTQGSASTVLVKENGKVSSEVTVKGNTLYIKLPALDERRSITSRSVGGDIIVVGNKAYDVQTEVFLTLPCLRAVRNLASMKFEVGRPFDTARGSFKVGNSGSLSMEISAVNHTDGSSISLHNSGSSRISMGKAAVETFSVDNSGSLTAEIKSVACGGNVTLDNSGSLRLTLPEVTAGTFECSNSGVANMQDMTVTASTFRYRNSGSDSNASLIRALSGSCRVSNSGVMKHAFEVGTDNGNADTWLDFVNHGVADGSIKFRGNSASMLTNGSGTIDADVDCLSLKLSIDGIAKVKLSGNAGEFTFSGSEERLDAASLKCGNLTKLPYKDRKDTWKEKADRESNEYNP